MLSIAHPFTNLFETIETEPMNYLQAIQELIETDHLATPEHHETPYEIAFVPHDTDIEMELDLNKITSQSVTRYKSTFYALGEFVAKGRTEVIFPGLEAAATKNTKESCCIWSTRHRSSPKRELIQLLSAIKSQSRQAHQRYVIKVVNG